MDRKGFNEMIDTWINDLKKINFAQICTKPPANSWSLGQVCMHLIEATNFYLEQIKICLTTNDHTAEEMTGQAKEMFRNSDFPDQIIEGPPANAYTPQPDSKEELIRLLRRLRLDLNEAKHLILENTSRGKTMHPGLQYLNAGEWYQFAEMHFRHHLRQKKRIEDYLKTSLKIGDK